MKSITVGAILIGLVACQAFAAAPSCDTAAGTTKIAYRLQLGGNNHYADYRNGLPSCDHPPQFTNGAFYDDTSPVLSVNPAANPVVTWAAEVTTCGVYADSTAAIGAANLVFSLGLHNVDAGGAVGGLVTGYQAALDSSGTTPGFFSYINSELANITMQRYKDIGSGGCGTALPTRKLAAFTWVYQIQLLTGDGAFDGFGSLVDGWAANGPFMAYSQHPSARGWPSAVDPGKVQDGELVGMGAGYTHFADSVFCSPNCDGLMTAGVGVSSGTGSCTALGVVPVFEGQLNTSGLANGTYALVLTPGKGNNVLKSTMVTRCGNATDPGAFASKPDIDPTVDANGCGDTIKFVVALPGCSGRTIAGRKLFYNNSYFDGVVGATTCPTCSINVIGYSATVCNDNTAVAQDKVALLPGVVWSFSSYSSFNKGINGVMIDITPGGGCARLSGAVDPANFVFKYGNTATPATWAVAPAPTSINAAPAPNGTDDRITILWADNPFPNANWLGVKVLATNFNLPANDYFYFGLAIGECNTPGTGTRIVVDPTDELGARANPKGGLTCAQRATITNVYDYNRDSKVDPSDQLIARSNQKSALNGLLKLNPAPAVGW